MPRITAAMCAHGRGLAEPLLSPDGRTVMVVVSAGGRPALVAIPVEGGPERIITTEPVPRSTTGYGGGVMAWMADSTAVIHAGGDGNLWMVDIAGGPARRLTDHHPDRGAGAPAVAPDGRSVAYVVDQHEVVVAPIEHGLDGRPSRCGWPVRLSGSCDFALDPAWNAEGSFVTWHEWDVPDMAWDQSRWAVAPPDGRGVIATFGEAGIQVGQPRFSPVSSDLAFVSDATGWLNLWLFGPNGDPDRPLVDEPFEHGGPTWVAGQRSTAWSPDGRRIAVTRNEAGFGRLCVVDVATGGLTDVARGIHTSLSWQGTTLVALRSGAVTPTQLVAYDDSTWQRRVLAHSAPAGLEVAAREPEPVSWPGEDGAVVHGLLYRPTSELDDRGGPPPLLVWVHGGPTSQWLVEWKARVPYFCDRGWAVLAVNHRGSTGAGRAYTQALRGRWGELDVADVASGMVAAAAQGWGDPRAMVPMGGSAGGFTVLHVLARHPELCAAGVALYPVADLFDLEERSHRFERHYNHSLVGALPEAAARYRERSPLSFAEAVRAPLLLLHGATDAVVPVEQSRAMASAVERAGGTVELHVYDGEGHGWGRPDTVVDELERTEAFLRRHVLRWRS